jgi:hypothetical protein
MNLNPFSTRFTNPGSSAIVHGADWLQSGSGQDVDQLARAFLRCGGLGQIVGPHGCGKSALGLALLRRLDPDRVPASMVIVRKQSGVPLALQTSQTLTPLSAPNPSVALDQRCPLNRIILLDGGEQLSLLHRFLMILAARRLNTGLVLTTHRALAGIPLIATLQPSIDHFVEIAGRLQQNAPMRLTDAQIRAAYLECNGDYRLSLRMLYDQYARQIHSQAPQSRSA